MIIGRSCTEKIIAGTYLRKKILCIKTINFFIQTDRISEKKFPTIVADSTVRPAMQQPASVCWASGEPLRQLHMSGVRTIRIVAQSFQKIFEHQKMKLRESVKFFHFLLLSGQTRIDKFCPRHWQISKLRIPLPPVKKKIKLTNELTQIQLAAHGTTRRSYDSCDSNSVNQNKH